MSTISRAWGRRDTLPHVHRCPECYEAHPCADDCEIELDLTLDDGRLCCGFYPCASCEEKRKATASEGSGG